MGVPFEALLPYAIMLGMFGFTGAALSKIRHMQNGGKRARHSIDQWDRQSTALPLPSLLPAQRFHLTTAFPLRSPPHKYRAQPRSTDTTLTNTVMDRDRRLTGFLRGQTDRVDAPPGFELNNPWRVETRIL
ncbi:hypothetical protein W97_05042 [Coniosporium apollinis CBS 100218]|uniref:NADH dehydrogenase [ubiquinone] 1 alpha subcomplex subunit 1 n=1 Tax=Coniosporium apollinis (strain CBS 100218) TaxID=1168221 RepID=R7YVC7_CONA1|nr:uncharacterized protein W97_05042 [Coniosporium apollinis CBS 100218]EON65803.1 hypothetical protein W97_05042 [Coniosporium apollinis CBS 100218]